MERRPTLGCPWCPHEATDGDAFRTHLMVEHRKSDLATYVLEREHAEAVGAGDGEDEERDIEAEVLAR